MFPHKGIAASWTYLNASLPLLLSPSRRSAEARTATAVLQEDMGSMLGWLDKAEGVLAIPLQPAEPQHIKDTLGKVQVPSTHQPMHTS